MVLDQIVNLVIRPPRAEYDPGVHLLGPQFTLRGREYRRHDVQLKNKRGHLIQCSHYRLHEDEPDAKHMLPCVVYCHGNSGCRADANDAALVLLPVNISVLALDFSGSGLSEGEFVSLGHFEVDDLEAAVHYLKSEGLSKNIGLWGRSMGGVTALLYAAKDPSVAGIVVDSPFSNLTDLILELVDYYKVPLPKFSVKMGIVPLMRRSIKQKASFDIKVLDMISVAPSTSIPALFAHAKDDIFIRPHHSKKILDAYAGRKNRITFSGDHNSPRPEFFFDSVSMFLVNALSPPPVRKKRRERDSDYGLDFMALREQLLAEKARQEGATSSNLPERASKPDRCTDKLEVGEPPDKGRTKSADAVAQTSSEAQEAQGGTLESVEELATSPERCGQHGANSKKAFHSDVREEGEEFLTNEDQVTLQCVTCSRLHELLLFPSRKLKQRIGQQTKKKGRRKRCKSDTNNQSPGLSRIASLRIPVLHAAKGNETSTIKKDQTRKSMQERTTPVVPAEAHC